MRRSEDLSIDLEASLRPIRPGILWKIKSGEMAQGLRVFFAHAEEGGLVPSSHMTAQNHSSPWESKRSSGVIGTRHAQGTYICRQNTNKVKFKN